MPTCGLGHLLALERGTPGQRYLLGNQNLLYREHAEQIVGWVREFADVEDRAEVVTLDEIKAEEWTLNITRCVLPPIGGEIPPLPEAVAALKEALAEARPAEDHLREVLTEGGWLS